VAVPSWGGYPLRNTRRVKEPPLYFSRNQPTLGHFQEDRETGADATAFNLHIFQDVRIPFRAEAHRSGTAVPLHAFTAVEFMSQARRLYALAFFSGAAALAYEVSWTKWLSLSFGSSTLGASAAVAGFMGGMGIGAWTYHRVQDRVASPLRLYAALEVAIAISAVGLTFILERLPPIFALVFSSIPESSHGVGVAVRIFGALSVLLLPTALMGATYPALCDVAISNRDALDRHLGALYGWNTIGAAAGGLVAGIALIPALGLDGAVAVGVALNLAVAVAALAFDVRYRLVAAPTTQLEEAGVVEEVEEFIPSRLPRGVVGLVLFSSGFATLAYEIVWFRAYRPIAGNSTFAFTIVLVTFLLGLGFGALALRRIVARGNPEKTLSLIQFGIALTAAMGIAALAHLLDSPSGMSLSIKDPSVRIMSWPLRLLLHGGSALVLMLPATLLMGLSFPFASRIYVGDVSRVGQRVGGAVLLANLGSILGSIGAATVLLPALGSMGSIRLLVGINVVLALVIAHFAPGLRRDRLRWVIPAVVAVAAIAVLIPAVAPYPWNPLGRFASRVIFEEDGELASVRVSESVENSSIRGISIDGTTIGVSRGWRFPIYSKQLLIAHLPMWLEPRIRNVLQIGLGSGSTLETLTRYPTLERIDSVEINGAVVRGARFFEEARAFSDPRVTVHVEDAIHYLLSTEKQYDLIISDGKQNADFSGNAKMLSQEFYQLALDRLSEEGLFVQWVGISSLPDDYKAILGTAASVFPYFNVFYEIPSSSLLVGSRRPLHDRSRMPGESVPKAVLESLASLRFRKLDMLGFGWMSDRAGLMSAIGPGPINRWSNSVIEFTAYRATAADWKQSQDALNLDLLLRARRLAVDRAPSDFVAADANLREAHRLIRVAYITLGNHNRKEAVAVLDRALELAPKDPLVHRARILVSRHR
jgi:spermidine synthase